MKVEFKKVIDNSAKVKNDLISKASLICNRKVDESKSIIESEIRANEHIGTGALLNAVYTVTDKGSSYQDACSSAKALNPNIKQFNPEIRIINTSTLKQSGIGIVVDYAGYPNRISGYLDKALNRILTNPTRD